MSPVVVIDNAVSVKLHTDVANAANDFRWETNHKSRADRGEIHLNQDWHWRSTFLHNRADPTTKAPAGSEARFDYIKKNHPTVWALWLELEKHAKRATGENLDLAHCYSNSHTYGMDGMIHQDQVDYTICYYPSLVWPTMWDGGTAFYNSDKTEIVQYVSYKPNRAVIFSAKQWHRPMPVSKLCLDLRVILVFKVSVKMFIN